MNSRQKIVQQRFLENEEELIRKINGLYEDCLKDVQDAIRDKYDQIDELTEQIEQLDEDDPKRKILESQRQAAVYQKKYQEQLDKQLSDITDNLIRNQYTTIAEYLRGCYDDGFLGTLYSMQGQGVPFSIPINQQAAVQAIQIDSKIKVGLYSKIVKDVDNLKKNIASQTSSMMVRGLSYEKAAERLSDQTKIGFNRSVRIIRTEGHRIQCTAAMDCMTDAKDRGADVVKQWDSTLDGRVRPTHRAVDGEWRELEEEFSNGLMFPGDPGGHPSEVVNCRCALLERARWALEDGFSKRNGFTDDLNMFHSPEDYEYFKDIYYGKLNIKYMEYIKNKELKYGEKNFSKLLDSISDSEYRKLQKLEKYSVNGIIQTGARIIDSYSEEAKEFARMYYDEIRSFSTDCKRIAKNLGKNESDIRKIKAYLFEDKSFYDEDEKAWTRFVPDCAIAQSWQRLIIGTDIKPHDITLIEHELYEMEIKKNNPGISHVKAHTLATKKYNYGRETSLYYGNLKKRNKNR